MSGDQLGMAVPPGIEVARGGTMTAATGQPSVTLAVASSWSMQRRQWTTRPPHVWDKPALGKTGMRSTCASAGPPSPAAGQLGPFHNGNLWTSGGQPL